jgi:hypothetical protein
MTGDADKPDKSDGAIILGWWRANLRPDPDFGPARGLRARLRRATHVVDVLAEPQVIALHDALGRRHDPVRLAVVNTDPGCTAHRITDHIMDGHVSREFRPIINIGSFPVR